MTEIENRRPHDAAMNERLKLGSARGGGNVHTWAFSTDPDVLEIDPLRECPGWEEGGHSALHQG
ncbi:hypothetical protein [Sphingomonas faeni]|uniref:hypothetical protein n=1 Tax=Sphingomonas faeni TaxID=185950 RepID=UPI002786BB60|nr:hypothetical protein [Sphingomonas faeni]MDQ0839224.1 hypothetical protein [Sphingomonas faeni]